MKGSIHKSLGSYCNSTLNSQIEENTIKIVQSRTARKSYNYILWTQNDNLHLFEANWSILKFSIGNQKLCTLAFSVAFLNRRDRISLLFLSVHVKDVKDAREVGRIEGFEIHFQILFMNSP